MNAMKMVKFGVVAALLMCAGTFTAKAVPFITPNTDSFDGTYPNPTEANGGMWGMGSIEEVGELVDTSGSGGFQLLFGKGAAAYTAWGTPGDGQFDFSKVTSISFTLAGDFTPVEFDTPSIWISITGNQTFNFDLTSQLPVGVSLGTLFTTGVYDFSLLTHVYDVIIGWSGINSKPETGPGPMSLLDFTIEGGTGVPEPETVWMMLAVLGSLAVTFRGQLSDLARRFVKS